MWGKGGELHFSIPLGSFRRQFGWPIWILTLGAACLLPVRNLRAQENPASQKPSPSTQGAASQNPSSSPLQKSQKTQQPPASAPKIQLENPGTAPSQGAQKPQQAPSPGNLQLQAPGVAPATPKAPQQHRNVQTIVTRIEFRGNRRIQNSALLARIFTRPGQVYNQNDIERDFMALWNTGYFDDIRAVATDDPKAKNGKIITFFVREKKLVRSIDYKGMSSVSVSDVMDRFRQEKVGLSIM